MRRAEDRLNEAGPPHGRVTQLVAEAYVLARRLKILPAASFPGLLVTTSVAARLVGLRGRIGEITPGGFAVPDVG